MTKEQNNNISLEKFNHKEEKQSKPKINEEYIKKILRLRKTIAISLVFFALILVLIFAIFFYSKSKVKNNTQEAKKIESKISELKNKAEDIKSRIYDVEKYKEVWLKATEEKKDFSERRVSEVNNIFNELVKKYDIHSPNINISAPEILRSGVYNKEHLNLHLVTFKITFKSFTDSASVNFIDEFFNKLKGYKIIENLEIKKDVKKIDNKQMLGISKGEIKSLVSTKLDFNWYFLTYPKDNEN